MFDNVTDLLLAGVSLSPQQQSQFDSVKSTPSLEFFNKNPQNYDPKDKNDKASFDKASLLRLIQAVFVISHDSKHPHQKMCKQFVDSANNSNILKTILSQLPDFQKVVLLETIIIIAEEKPNYFTNPDFVKTLMEYAKTVPSHLKPLICFPLLQYISLKDVFDEKIKSPNEIPRDLLEEIDDKVYAPLITATYLISDHNQVNNSLKCFDIFEILRSSWMISAIKLLSPKALSICCNHVFSFVSLFIKIFIKDITAKLFESRLIPLVSATLRKEPQNFMVFIDKVYNVFSQRSLICTYSSIISIASSACSNPYNAQKILEKFIQMDNHAEPLIKQLFSHLKYCLMDVISTEVSDDSWNTFFLLQRFTKYLCEDNLKLLIHKFVTYTRDQVPPEEEPFVFYAFLFEFFENPLFSRFATKSFAYSSVVYPHEARKFLEDLMLNNSLSHKKFTDIMNSDTRNICALTRAAKIFIANHFTFATMKQPVSPFVTMLIKQYFPDCVYKKFDTHAGRWKALKIMLEAALDLSVCSHEFAFQIQNDEGFVRSLLAIILASSNVIQKPHTISNENESDRFDFNDLLPIIEFLSIALALFELLVSINLISHKEISYLCKTFFDGHTDIFSTLISLLQLPQAFASTIRFAALRIIDLMCAVAAKMNNISVDSFYPNSKQAVLVDSSKQNLFHAIDVEQTINELDFISHTLITQTAFAYSFVRRLGRAYATTAVDKLDEIGKDFPRLLMSLALFLSQVWRKLNASSETIKAIAGKPNFWSSVDKIITSSPTTKSEDDTTAMIAAKAYFLRCKVCSDEQVSDTIVKSVIDQLAKFLPEILPPLKTNIKIDMNNFIVPKIHRIIGEEFYFDVNLLKRFLVVVDGSEEFIAHVKKINVSLSRIDACTQLMQALYALLASRTKYEKEELMPDTQLIVNLVISVISNPLTPDSTSRVAFQLLEFSLLNKKGASAVLTVNDIKVLIKFLQKRPISEAFRCLPYLFALSAVPLANDNGQPLIAHMMDSCFQFAIMHNNADAIKTAAQIALILRDEDGWISGFADSLNFAMPPLMNSVLANEMVNFITVVCQNDANSEFLINEGFFENFITNELPCAEDWKSPLWPALFDMMAQLPPQSEVAFMFAQKTTTQIAVFLQNRSIEGMKQIDLLKAQTAALGVLSSIGSRLVEQTTNAPSLLSKLIELILVRLHSSIALIRDKGQVKLEGRIEDTNDRNEKLTIIVALQYCFMIISSVYEYPYGGPFPTIFEEILNVSMYTFLSDVLESIEEIACKKDNRPYLDIVARIYGLALRLYVARVKAITNQMMTPREENEKKGQKLRGAMTKALKATESLINETAAANMIEEASFFDKMRKYLLECYNK